MKNLSVIVRIWNPFVFALISCLCSRVFSISVAPPTPYDDDYPTESSSSLQESEDDPFNPDKPDEIEVENKFSKTMIDHDERRIRNFVHDHEIPRETPVKVKIVGDLATPPPVANIDLGFVPKQTYVQVRRHDDEIHLPRSAALAEAETAEELLNAPRLREVVSQKKTQEVYEEQGYEDAAYDHGGYKKAGEHRETKFVPRNDKTDYTHITDQSTEQAILVDVGRYNSTDSSQAESRTTTEKSTTPTNQPSRKTKRPKTRPWSRHRQPVREATTKRSPDDHAKKTSSSSSPPRRLSANRRRRLKTAKNATDETKLMEESKYHSTKQLITELDIKPTTYRPVPFRISKVEPRVQRRPTFKPPTLLGTDGYKFEYPFENFTDFNNLKTTTVRPAVAVAKPPKLRYVHEKENVVYQRRPEPIKYGESSDSDKVYSTTVAKRKPFTLYETKLKIFPYELVRSKKSRFEKQSQEKRIKLNFPYEIVDVSSPATGGGGGKLSQKSFSGVGKGRNGDVGRMPTIYAQNALTRTTDDEFKRARKKPPTRPVHTVKPVQVIPKAFNLPGGNEQQLRVTSEFDFGQPDSSPWIPITPKDIYDIHGYEGKAYTPSHVKNPNIKVREQENSAEVLDKNLRFSPIRVYDGPKTISTSYTIHHVYPANKPRGSGNYASSLLSNGANNHDLHDTAESMHEPNTFTSTTEFSPPAQLDSYRQNPPTTTASTPDIESKTSPNPYDIITAHSSDIRDAFTPREETLTTRPAYHLTTASKREDAADEPTDIETLSSNRYAIFQRMNYTTPLESTTASLADLNDEFNKLFLDERHKFLFRHPHLPRETSKFVKTQPSEEPVKNTTSKRDIVFSSVKNGTITQLTKVSKRNDVYQKPILVYPQDYTSSAKYVERLTLAHYSLPENVAYNPLPLDYHSRIATLANHLKNDTRRTKRQLEDADKDGEPVNVFLGGTTTEIIVNVKKYPFYKTVPPDGISKYSVLRYVSNPSDIPKKHVGQMAFYESRDKVQCAEPSPPQNIVPHREDGEWAFDRRPQVPRITLGDKIACLKMKFFGSDPLDNPFFKEESVGFPEVFDKEERAEPYLEARQPIEDVESQNDYEVLPKRFLKSIRKKQKPTALFKREAGTTVVKSPVRLWIESLAESPYSSGEFQKLYKRSALEKFESDAASRDDDKRVQKVLYVGGFLNRENLVDKKKIKKHKFRPTETPTMPDMSEDATTSNELDYEDVSQHAYPTVTTSIFESESVTQAFASNSQEEESSTENSSAEEGADGTSEEGQDADNSKFFQKLSTAKVENTMPTVSIPKYLLPLPGASEIKSKSNKNKKKLFVDALSSLRSQQNSSKNETSRSNTRTHKYDYKEPTWRIKKPTSPSVTTAGPVSAHEVDSLLYVIHPKTGEGKWMKLLKVEEIDDTTKSDSLSIGNDASSNTVTLPSYYSGYRKDHYQVPCREENETQRPLDSEYDVYHISGLLKQVAPLKASEAEINNLQTTEDQIEDEDDESGSYSDPDDLSHPITQFPEPHERLYYYVIDDGTNE